MLFCVNRRCCSICLNTIYHTIFQELLSVDFWKYYSLTSSTTLLQIDSTPDLPTSLSPTIFEACWNRWSCVPWQKCARHFCRSRATDQCRLNAFCGATSTQQHSSTAARCAVDPVADPRRIRRETTRRSPRGPTASAPRCASEGIPIPRQAPV